MYKYLFSLFFLLSLCACSDQNELVVTPPEGGGNGDPVTITFSVNTRPMESIIVGEGSGVLTRADEPIDDAALDDIWVLLYDAAGNLIESAYSTAMKHVDGKQWDIDIALYTDLGTECYMYCVANTHDDELFLPKNQDAFATVDLLKTMVYTIDAKNPETMWQYTAAGEDTPHYSIPMRGVGRAALETEELNKAAGEATTLETEPELIELATDIRISLHYLLSRITLTVNSEDGSNVDIKYMQLYNVPATYGYFQDEAALLAGKNKYMYYPVVAATDAQAETYTWYMPRNLVNTNTVADEATSTHIKVVGYSTTKEESRGYYFYPHKPGGTVDNPTYDFNLDGGDAIHYTATLTGTRLAVLATKKHWSVAKPERVKSDANSIIIRSDALNYSAGHSFDIAPQLAKYGTYKATGSLKLADVDMANATEVIADGATWTAEVVWQTAPNLITLVDKTGKGPEGHISFTLPEADIQGNALIAVKVGSNIVWSWHLWVLNHDPGTTVYTPNNTDAAKTVPAIEYTFLDYALGATTNDKLTKDSWGLYYQWGRKDPFTIEGAQGAVAPGYYKGDGTQYSNPASSAGGGTSNFANLAQSVKEPNVFIITNWRGSTATGATAELAGPAGAPSWGGYDSAYGITSYLTDKTVFDPCPAGYRVPPIGAFGNELSNADNKLAANFKFGYDWTTITGGYEGSTSGPGIFSAGGSRSSNTGALNNQGTNGYYWSASLTTDASGYYLTLNSGFASPRVSSFRANGCGVRCVCL